MKRAWVAVLDIRSGEVTVTVGARDVNHTIAFRAIRSEEYDGFADGYFYSVKDLKEAVFRALFAVEQTCGDRIREIYVGVPGEFTYVLHKEQNVGYQRAKRFTQRELNKLYFAGAEEKEEYRLIRAAGMKFITADNRLVLDPVGMKTTGLNGLLSYFYCSDCFVEAINEVFQGSGVKVNLLPAEYAECIYLLPPDVRDEGAVLLDLGLFSSTVCCVLGNGVYGQFSFGEGRGTILGRVMARFSLPFEAADKFCAKINLYLQGNVPDMECDIGEKTYTVRVSDFLEEVRLGLDDICEQVFGYLESGAGEEFRYKPVYATGEGLSDFRGAEEHLTRRLNRIVEGVVPELPYYDKYSASSKVSLADLAYEDNLKKGFIYQLINGKGGF